MKESEINPICPNCGSISREDSASNFSYCHPSLLYKKEIFSGCPFCYESLIVGFDGNICCSNPKCPGWKVHKNGEIRYDGKLIFSASHKDRRVIVFNGRGTLFPKMSGFYGKLLDKIMKIQCKSNIHKGLHIMVV